ncbi:sodium channel protein type 5 subunit alpha-like [Platysternon megacephalum]|uniref:Sodium channel protein type 5 subunit alpha-like n=1 Tax=Platysternon megacephalum TaxID=55544 RepID=A0A4D9DX28_9SAUR|nr:sodium channel protein type 5 subunit alpha-like [Platysternon megacephalum]
MDRYPFFVFVLCGVFLPRVLCFPHENPTIDCETMLPHHGGEPQKSTPPYVIAVSFDKYDPGNEIQVTLEGTAERGFQGFHLQARELEGAAPVGSFKITDPSTQALACHNVSNSAVSHTNSEVKHKVTTTWIAPSNTKSIQFRATFVQDSKNFWVGVLSKTVTPTPSQSANVTERRNKKKASRIVIEMECTKKGGTYSSSGGCIQGGSSGSSQTIYSIGQVGVISPGGSPGGCVPGTDGIYSKYGCKDSAVPINTGMSYGQSVSSGSGVKKPVSYPDSNPYPPVRETFPSVLANSGYGSSIIHSQGGQRVNPCDRSSSSYNIIICKLSQSSTSQNSNTEGQGQSTFLQGSQVISQGSQQGGSSSSGVSMGCGEGTSYDSNPCHQGSQSNSGSSNRDCDQSSSNCAGNKVIVARDTSRALSRSSYNGQNESSSTNSSSANVQGGAFISFNKTSSGQGLPSGGNQSGGDGSHSSDGSQISSAGKLSSPSLLLLFSVLSAFATSSVVPKWFI